MCRGTKPSARTCVRVATDAAGAKTDGGRGGSGRFETGPPGGVRRGAPLRPASSPSRNDAVLRRIPSTPEDLRPTSCGGKNECHEAYSPPLDSATRRGRGDVDRARSDTWIPGRTPATSGRPFRPNPLRPEGFGMKANLHAERIARRAAGFQPETGRGRAVERERASGGWPAAKGRRECRHWRAARYRRRGARAGAATQAANRCTERACQQRRCDTEAEGGHRH